MVANRRDSLSPCSGVERVVRESAAARATPSGTCQTSASAATAAARMHAAARRRPRSQGSSSAPTIEHQARVQTQLSHRALVVVGVRPLQQQRQRLGRRRSSRRRRGSRTRRESRTATRSRSADAVATQLRRATISTSTPRKPRHRRFTLPRLVQPVSLHPSSVSDRHLPRQRQRHVGQEEHSTVAAAVATSATTIGSGASPCARLPPAAGATKERAVDDRQEVARR